MSCPCGRFRTDHDNCAQRVVLALAFELRQDQPRLARILIRCLSISGTNAESADAFLSGEPPPAYFVLARLARELD